MFGYKLLLQYVEKIIIIFITRIIRITDITHISACYQETNQRIIIKIYIQFRNPFSDTCYLYNKG